MANLLAPPRRYEYRMYRTGRYLGLLPQPENDFQYSQDLNTAGTGITLQIRASADLQNEQPEYLTTEAGEYLLTEAGEYLTTERKADIVGNANSNALIRNNNTIIIYEYSQDYPNGIIVFQGWVSKWKAKYATTEDLITVNCISNGSELDNYLIQGASVLDQSQPSYTGYGRIYEQHTDKVDDFSRIGQTFKPGVSAAESTIQLYLSPFNSIGPSPTVTLKLWANVTDYYSGGTPLGTATATVSGTPLTFVAYNFTFPVPPNVIAGSTYFFSVIAEDGNVGGGVLYLNQSPGTYANGDSYASTYASQPWYTSGTGDMLFQTYYTSGATSSPYTSTDPTSILRSIVDGYVARGGTINYSASSTTLTGLSRSYTFKVNTILTGIKKCRELAPYTYYWYVHPATNTLYFKPVSATAEHTFILGNHVFELELEASVEEVKNQTYFTGGDTGSNVYLYTSLADTTALAANAGRVGLQLLSDNRVTLSDTALALMQNFLNGNKNESYNTVLTVSADKYDVNTIYLGQTVGFGGYGNFIDSLVLQIVRLERFPDYVRLTLGVLPKRASTQVEEIDRQLTDVQTIYNPSAPS